jgi:hypothetical protein
MHKGIASAVNRVESVNDRKPYIVVRRQWCDTIVPNVHTSTEGKIDKVKSSKVKVIP